MAKGPDTTRAFEEWQAMSRQYWDAWNEATRKAFSSVSFDATSVDAPWHEGLEQWSRMFSQQGSQSEIVERLLTGAKGYFSLLQSLAAKTAGQNGETNPHAWADALRESFNLPVADAALFDNPLARALQEIAGKGAKGFEDMMKGVMPFAEETRALFGMPAFGYLREHQEHYQHMAQAMLDYQQQTHRYNMLIARASRHGFEVFEDKLAERAEPGRQIDSVRALYDLWVDAAEEAYSEIALSPEFREVYGALVNAQMRVRKHVQAEVERIATDLGMPTRSEIDSIGKRLHEVRRDLKNRDEQLPALVAEIAALRAEVEALKSTSRKSGTPSKTVQLTATRKPTAAKQSANKKAKR
ncbi:MAG: class III poly(R)-hydroxyalkanoic acid synthase subunit PhaE [Rhodanobacteraceae bacterium]